MVSSWTRRARLSQLGIGLCGLLAAGCSTAPIEPDFEASLHEAEAEGAFAGEVVVQDRGRIIYQKAFGAVSPGGDTLHQVGQEWRWASVSKMVTALLILEQVEKGALELDTPVTTYLGEAPDHFDKISVRQLLNHTSGLINPDDDEELSWYKGQVPRRAFCNGPPSSLPGEQFSYNNCDFLVLADVLEAVTGSSFEILVNGRLGDDLGLSSVRLVTADDDDAAIPGYAEGERVERGFVLSVFGAGGAIVGAPEDLTALNHAVMSGDLLTQDEVIGAFTTGVPELGFVALGAWAYDAELPGCDAPLRLVERRGDIEGVHVLTMLDIEHDRSFAMFSNRAETDWGWIWARQGLAFDVATEVFCGL